MGRWGEGLFEGDADLHEAASISDDANIELLSFEHDPQNPEHPGKGIEATREHLNNGTLDRLFKEYATKKADWQVNKDLRFVFLAALAMRVGAYLSPSCMETIRTSIPKLKVSPKYSLPLFDTHFRAPAKVQIGTALKYYKNDSTPYDFYADRCGNPSCAKAQCDLVDGQKLLKCGKCKEVYYCGKECQSAAWQTHQKSCQTPEQREMQRQKEQAGRPWMSLNV